MIRERAGQRVSKTQRKKDSEALQSLGEALIGLPSEELDRLGLPAALREALELAGRLTKHGAQRRQRQYIGRLMRDLDPTAIRAYVNERRANERAATRRLHAIEAWRDRLLGDDDSVLSACAVATGADTERLRELRRAARHAQNASTRKTASRALFRYLHDVESRGGDAGN